MRHRRLLGKNQDDFYRLIAANVSKRHWERPGRKTYRARHHRDVLGGIVWFWFFPLRNPGTVPLRNPGTVPWRNLGTVPWRNLGTVPELVRETTAMNWAVGGGIERRLHPKDRFRDRFRRRLSRLGAHRMRWATSALQKNPSAIPQAPFSPQNRTTI